MTLAKCVYVGVWVVRCDVLQGICSSHIIFFLERNVFLCCCERPLSCWRPFHSGQTTRQRRSKLNFSEFGRAKKRKKNKIENKCEKKIKDFEKFSQLFASVHSTKPIPQYLDISIYQPALYKLLVS